MTKKPDKDFLAFIIISSLVAIYCIVKVILIKRNPNYILAKITKITVAKQTNIFYEFTYENKLYKKGMDASAQGFKIGDYYLIEFQKSNPSNCRPIFNVDSWRCVLNDSSYYYGSAKKPNCEY